MTKKIHNATFYKLFKSVLKVNEIIEKHHFSITIFLGICAILTLVSHFSTVFKTAIAGEKGFIMLEHITTVSHFLAGVIALLFLAFTFMRTLSEPFIRKVRLVKDSWNDILNKVAIKIEAKNEYCTTEFSQQDFEDLARFAVEAYGIENRDYEERVVMFKEWYRGNTSCFSFIYNEKQERIGYVSVLPLISSRHYVGSSQTGRQKDAFSQFNIDSHDIAKNGFAKYILLQGIYVEKRYISNSNFTSDIVYEILLKIAKFAADESTIVYSEVFYRSGEIMCNLMGMNHTDKSKVSHEGHRIFEMPLEYDKLRSTAKANGRQIINLISMIKGNITNGIYGN
ncbi:MAG: hypothetical protein EOO46_16605 [Flavobacterium sp.]|nr:MAG: hypothetical protein EOO46_16605 [Flavobacterium sp.]